MGALLPFHLVSCTHIYRPSVLHVCQLSTFPVTVPTSLFSDLHFFFSCLTVIQLPRHPVHQQHWWRSLLTWAYIITYVVETAHHYLLINTSCVICLSISVGVIISFICANKTSLWGSDVPAVCTAAPLSWVSYRRDAAAEGAVIIATRCMPQKPGLFGWIIPNFYPDFHRWVTTLAAAPAHRHLLLDYAIHYLISLNQLTKDNMCLGLT